jgi:hypothetical protein
MKQDSSSHLNSFDGPFTEMQKFLHLLGYHFFVLGIDTGGRRNKLSANRVRFGGVRTLNR